MSSVLNRDKVFVSYSHKDAEWLERLQVHLKPLQREGKVDWWDDTRINAGMKWRMEIKNAIDVARVAVLLISADFLASDFIAEYELPPLLRAAESEGMTILPVIISPSRYQNDKSLSEFQSINKPSQPVIDMEKGESEKLWDLLAARIEEALKSETGIGTGIKKDQPEAIESADVNSSLILLDLPPAVGIFINRDDYISGIKKMLSNKARKLLIVQGFIGIGKTQLAAKVVQEIKKQFEGILWINCQENEASADFLFAKLNAFFEQHNEKGLSGIWNNPLDELFDLKINRLLQILTTRPYLLVFDRFHYWLTPDLDVKNAEVKKIFNAILRNEHQSKIIVISDNRALLDPETFETPVGAIIEQSVFGLDKVHSIELLKETGLILDDESLLERIAEYCDGNPSMLSIFSYLVTGLHHDPEELLSSGKMHEKINNLLVKSVKDLNADGYNALALLSVIRISLNKKQINAAGLQVNKIAPLLDRFLITRDQHSGRYAVSTAIKNFMQEQLSEHKKEELHKQAAVFFASSKKDKPENYEEIQMVLEEAHHHFQSGNAEQAATIIFSVAPHLIDRGYIDMAEQNILQALDRTEMPASKAEGHWLRAAIADLRGNHRQALRFFESALSMYESLGSYGRMGLTFFRIGRIHNALSAFELANDYFEKCIHTCKTYGVHDGWAASLLGMAWNYQEQSADIKKDIEKILALYKEIIELAAEDHDMETLSSSYRQTGFLLWTKLEEKEKALWNYDQAMSVAKNNFLKKETAGIYSELGYLYSEWKQFDKARENCEEAIKIFQSLGDQYGLTGAYFNLGKTYDESGDGETAIMYYNESRKLAADINNNGAEAWAYYSLGKALLKQKKISEAESVLLKAAELSKQYKLGETLEVTNEELLLVEKLKM